MHILQYKYLLSSSILVTFYIIFDMVKHINLLLLLKINIFRIIF